MTDAPPRSDGTQDLIMALESLRRGDLTPRLSDSPAAGAFNELAAFLESMVTDLSQFAHSTAVDGDLSFRLETAAQGGAWKSVVESFNSMNSILGEQMKDVRRVADAVAEGDLSQKVEIMANGDIGDLKDSLNAMIDQLAVLKASVNRMMEQVKQMGLAAGHDPSRN